MRISDWSSDVCSSDLSEDRAIGVGDVLKRGTTEDALAERGDHRAALHDRAHFHAAGRATILLDHATVLRHVDKAADRKSVGSGKSVSVRVDPGGRRFSKKKQNSDTNNMYQQID